MALRQACVLFYGKAVVSRESIFQCRWRRVGPGKAVRLQKQGDFSFWSLLCLLSTVLPPSMLSVKKNTHTKKHDKGNSFPFCPVHFPKNWNLQGPSLLRLSDAFWIIQMLVSSGMCWKSSRLDTRSPVNRLCDCRQVPSPLWASL